ncbi:MAG: DUF6017 domain-containing protein [Lachnospiraceae bacterium]|nr:DUF6017 domain-containing protein [Lachnospiraceae bacterium]
MAVFRVEKNESYTVMSNYHLRDKELSLKAKGLLSQMLSLPEDWDYTLKGLAHINRESVDAIRTAVWELEQKGYIKREQARDGKGKMTDMVYTIYEQPQPVLENPTPENPALGKPTSGKPVSENPTQLNTYKTIKDSQNTDSFPSFQEPGQTDMLTGKERREADAVSEYEEYRARIRKNIEYEYLIREFPYDVDHIDEIVDLMLETVCAKRKVTRVAKTDVPHEVVRSEFLRLNCEHIRFVLICLKENTTRIRNIKQYLLTTLYNAPKTISNYYTALVAHDMANGVGVEGTGKSP